jgi:hypothetical protein
MSDTFISVKIPTLVDASALHVGSGDTAADTLSLRITDGVTNMTRQRIFDFLETVKMAIIAGQIHGTKFPYL